MSREHKISEKILERYNVSPKLTATVHEFGNKYGRKVIDLRDDLHVARIDSFVRMYPDQPYFTLREPSAKADRNETEPSAKADGNETEPSVKADGNEADMSGKAGGNEMEQPSRRKRYLKKS